MLKARQIDVLRLVVQTFTSTDHPVGSATLQKLGIKASAATIRNDLALLEDQGFLEKTHVSSGRVPSLKGYRYYVDHLLSSKPLNNGEREGIHRQLNDGFYIMNDLVAHSAKVLSQLTRYTTFVSELDHDDRQLTAFQLNRLNSKQLLAVMITNRGQVEHHIYPVIESLSDQEIAEVDAFVNRNLVSLTLQEIRQRLRTQLPMTLHKDFDHPSIIIQLLNMIFDQAFSEKFYTSGAMNLLTTQYKDNIEQFKELYNFINNPVNMSALIAPTNHSLNVKIGDELNNQLLSNLSLITTSYHVEGHGHGTIALLGPANMDYDEVIRVINGFKCELEQQINDYYRMLNYSQL